MTTVIEMIMAEWKQGDTYNSLSVRLEMKPSEVMQYYNMYPKVKTTHPIKLRHTSGQGETRNYAQRLNRLAALADVRMIKQARHDGPHGAYDLLTVPDNGCRYPYGETDFTFCGVTRDPNCKGRYCTQHARLVYQPRASEPQRRQRA